MDVSTLAPEVREAALRKVTAQLWERGNLRYKLDSVQCQIKAAIDSSKGRKFMLLCSRRLGKTFTMVLIALETALRKPNARILYLAPTAKDAASIVQDIVTGYLLNDCPDHIKAGIHFNAQQKVYTLPNGSTITFAGVNGEHVEDRRGLTADLIIGDECGSWDELEYAISGVLSPMLMTSGGRMLLATTPPRSPSHYSAALYETLAGSDSAIKFTILDNPRVSDEVKAEFLKEAGEKSEDIPRILSREIPAKTTTALREYFCEFVTDAESAVVPEFDALAERECVKVVEPPVFRDLYVGLDPGFRDRTGLVFGYWDFLRAKYVIEDEILLQGPSTLEIADAVKRKEMELWGDKTPHLRVSDIDLRLCRDLWEHHQIQFVSAQKQNSLEAINLLRNAVKLRQIEIHPRCKNVIRQMHNATWNKKATDFERSAIDGHFDLIAALKYMLRSVQKHRDPYPAGYVVRSPGTFRSPKVGRRSKGNDLGLMDDTPFTRKVAQARRRTK